MSISDKGKIMIPSSGDIFFILFLTNRFFEIKYPPIFLIDGFYDDTASLFYV